VKRFAAVLLVLPLIAGCSIFGDDGGWHRNACAPAKPSDKGLVTLQLSSGGVERTALLYVPDTYDGSVEFPLVFNWHGYSSNAVDHMKYADLLPLADAERFLIVAPQALGYPTRFNLGAGITGDTDDVLFASDLIDRVALDHCVDQKRVYSVGVSNGAGMSAVLACKLPERFAAIGMVALLLHPDGCKTPSPAVLGMMGDADLVVPFQGGQVNCCGGWDIAPAGHTMDAWAAQLHCRDHEDDSVSDHVDRRTWTGCDRDREVVYYIVHGGGHTWPGSAGDGVLGPTNREISASHIMWDFFKRYTVDAN
jgi:polyhydroxybutyrate depolymerase